MTGSDRAVRIILTLVCVLAIVPLTMMVLTKVMRLEARNSYRYCQKALTRSLRRSA